MAFVKIAPRTLRALAIASFPPEPRQLDRPKWPSWMNLLPLMYRKTPQLLDLMWGRTHTEEQA